LSKFFRIRQCRKILSGGERKMEKEQHEEKSRDSAAGCKRYWIAGKTKMRHINILRTALQRYVVHNVSNARALINPFYR
jgi:hypothetical protein